MWLIYPTLIFLFILKCDGGGAPLYGVIQEGIQKTDGLPVEKPDMPPVLLPREFHSHFPPAERRHHSPAIWIPPVAAASLPLVLTPALLADVAVVKTLAGLGIAVVGAGAGAAATVAAATGGLALVGGGLAAVGGIKGAGIAKGVAGTVIKDNIIYSLKQKGVLEYLAKDKLHSFLHNLHHRHHDHGWGRSHGHDHHGWGHHDHGASSWGSFNPIYHAQNAGLVWKVVKAFLL